MAAEVLFVTFVWFLAVAFAGGAFFVMEEEPKQPLVAAIYFILAAVCLVVGALVAFGLQRG